MTRKDTILIAVVINAGLLAILFTTAVIYDTDRTSDQMEFLTPMVENKSVEPAATLVAMNSSSDDVDNVLKYYTTSPSQPLIVQSEPEIYLPKSTMVQSSAIDDQPPPVIQPPSPPSKEGIIEYTVKRGDVLEKIAKTNKTSVEAIQRANQLDSERLSIGQILKIPGKSQASTSANAPVTKVSEIVKKEPKKEVKAEPKVAEPVYYIIKSGDNPWNIAKQFGVKYDEILRLNQLDEEKACKLKIGDRIRVK